MHLGRLLVMLILGVLLSSAIPKPAKEVAVKKYWVIYAQPEGSMQPL